MRIAVSILFMLVCVALTAIVLMQEGKSAGLGSIAGQVTANMSKTKAATVENKLQWGTKISAIVFVVLSLLLWILG
jgi:preprotein translocase subunit SecG